LAKPSGPRWCLPGPPSGTLSRQKTRYCGAFLPCASLRNKLRPITAFVAYGFLRGFSPTRLNRSRYLP